MATRSKLCGSGKFQRPKTHTCVTCKAFKLKELQQFSRLLGIETRKKDRNELCREIRKFVKPQHFGELVDKIEARRSRVRKARRRSSEKMARGEPLFGGYRRPARKSIVEWASFEPSFDSSIPAAPLSSASSFTPPPAPPAPAPGAVPKKTGIAALYDRLLGAPAAPPRPPTSFSFGSSIPEAPPAPSSSYSYSMPSMSVSLEDVSVVEYDPDYAEYNPGHASDEDDLDEYYEYDEPYVTSRVSRSRKDWRDLVREGYFSKDQAAAPAAPVIRLTAPIAAPVAPKAPVAPREPSAEFVDDLTAIQDFIRAYSKKKYATESGRAAAMTSDIRNTSNVTKDYGKWKQEPWNYDWEGIDTQGSAEDFMGNLRSGGFLRSDKNPKERLTAKERAEYLG